MLHAKEGVHRVWSLSHRPGALEGHEHGDRGPWAGIGLGSGAQGWMSSTAPSLAVLPEANH